MRFSFTIPEGSDVLQRLFSLAGTTGRSESDLVLEALSAYLAELEPEEDISIAPMPETQAPS